MELLHHPEISILWPPHAKNWLMWKDPNVGKDWRREEKGTTEDEVVGWHHWLNGYAFEQAPGVGDAQKSLACCNSWGCKESGRIEWLNRAELNWKRIKNNFGSQATENPGDCGLLFIFFPRVPTLAVFFKWLSQPPSLLGQALVSKWASRSRCKVWFWCVKGNGVDVGEAKRVELNSLWIFGEEWKV